VLGHRGARRAAPENTLLAFELAAQEGADGVELDVRLTADRKVVVAHDPSLERVTGGRDRRLVEALSLHELRSVDVGRGERAPELSSVLDWARARDRRVNIELKRDVRELARLVTGVARLVRAERDAPDRLVLSSFDPAAVGWLARLVPNVAVCWLVHARQRVLRGAPGFWLLRAAGVHAEQRLATPERVARWRRRGGVVGVWTVNEPAMAQKLAASGVDTLISDCPGAILAALSESAAWPR
jgi:glycerophosphoryl diester phosphodiesterase